MVSSGKLGTDFTEGKISGLMVSFMIPFLMANLLNSFYSMVDMAVIGQYTGSAGTVAVSMGSKLLAMLTNISTSIAGGGQILISQLAGKKRREEIPSAICTIIVVLETMSLLFGLSCAAGAVKLMEWLNTPAESFEEAVRYCVITSCGLPFLFGYNAVSSILRGMGDSRRPLMFVAIASAINLALDMLFVAGFGLGAAGAALATVLAQGFSLAVSLVLLYHWRERLGIGRRWEGFVFDAKKMEVILKVGVPLAMQSVFINATQLFMISRVNLYGVLQAAAYNIADKITHISNTINLSIKQAGGTVVAQNVGADRYDRGRQCVGSALSITLPVAVLIGAAALAKPQMMFRIFTSEPEVLAYSQSFMQIATLAFLLSAANGSYDLVTTGTGNSGLAFVGGLLDGVVLRIGLSFFFGYVCGMEILGFFLGNTLARLGPLCLNAFYFYSGAWERRKKLI